MKPLVQAIVALLSLSACDSADPVPVAGTPKEQPMPSAADIARRIDVVAPAGTPAAAVIAWLDREGVEHSGLVEEGRLVEAIWRDVETRGLVKRSVQARIRFGADGRREAVETRDVHTGP
jgi:hypothetical protein